ncbi:CPBP family intramembrane glutamic endopeptidase [Sungkyunkwania multivorans]|uniref:CPBP family intramembrane glutamic endopeptidase n=1 Tax=Sungkyunkwania multivorans TaxID=1173618 RepID=A0ABW3CW37_9FLAO
MKHPYKMIELVLLFVLLPVSYVLDYSIWIKIVLTIIGFSYVVWILLRVEKLPFKVNERIAWWSFWKRTLIQLSIIALVTTATMYFFKKELLFNVLLNKPLLYIIILFVYSFLSVYPQELIYRTFFFQRYEKFFSSSMQLIFVNATLFSLAHLFFELNRPLVLTLTFIGGLLFAYTFQKTRSTLLVSIEHAIYGSWLFTVGIGGMLGFPS